MSPPLMWKGFHNIVNTKTNTRSTFVEARGSKRRGVNIVLRLGTQYRDNDPHIYLQRPLQSGLNRRAAAHLFRPSLLKQSSLLSAPHRPPLPTSTSTHRRSANPLYRHPSTGTWGGTGWWTCPTPIRVRAKDKGRGCLRASPPCFPALIR